MRTEHRDASDSMGRMEEAAARAANGARGRTDRADAFMPDPEDGPARIDDDLAEVLAEDFLRSATSGEDADDDALDEIVPEEYGGPFVETSASDEFGQGSDDMNPPDAEPEPLPRAVHGLTTRPR